MKSLPEWLDEYAESHQNPTNKKLHWLCVPTILFSLIGMSWQISTLLTIILLALLMLFYVRLSYKLALAMGLLILLMVAAVSQLPVNGWFYLAVFVVAWIGQFYGHRVEGKKPSFFTDILFLGVGPAWCMDALMKRYCANWWLAS